MPSWDVSNVPAFNNAFLNRTTFNGDLSRWDTSSATSFFRMFQNAQAFNQDISDWDVTAGTFFEYMFDQAISFNQDIRKWQIDSGDQILNIFNANPAMATAFGTHPFFGNTPQREFFYAPDLATSESVAFPTAPLGGH